MVKGTIAHKYFNRHTGAVVRPMFDYDELGDDYYRVTDNVFPVFSMNHRYIGYISNGAFSVSWSSKSVLLKST